MGWWKGWVRVDGWMGGMELESHKIMERYKNNIRHFLMFIVFIAERGASPVQLRNILDYLLTIYYIYYVLYTYYIPYISYILYIILYLYAAAAAGAGGSAGWLWVGGWCTHHDPLKVPSGGSGKLCV